jgi:hypothetical protein
VLVDRHQEGPPQLWTAPPEGLANLLAPLIFPIASRDRATAFRAPTMTQLEMEHDWLTRYLARKRHGTDLVAFFTISIDDLRWVRSYRGAATASASACSCAPCPFSDSSPTT